jgi:TRAP-type transport system small permease protein
VIERIAARLGRGLDRLLGLVLCAVVLLNFVSAALRYLGAQAIVGADEMQVYAVVWLVFIGAAIASWRRSHLRMDVLTHGLSGRRARLREWIEHAIALATCGAMCWVSLQFVLQVRDLGQRSDGAGIPMWIPHAAVLVGFGLMTADAVHRLARIARAQDR